MAQAITFFRRHIDAEAVAHTTSGQCAFQTRNDIAGAVQIGQRLATRRGIDDRAGIVGKGVVECSDRSEEHTSELQSLMRISYAVFCLTKKKKKRRHAYCIENSDREEHEK